MRLGTKKNKDKKKLDRYKLVQFDYTDYKRLLRQRVRWQVVWFVPHRSRRKIHAL